MLNRRAKSTPTAKLEASKQGIEELSEEQLEGITGGVSVGSLVNDVINFAPNAEKFVAKEVSMAENFVAKEVSMAENFVLSHLKL